ncbi:MAG TPA: PAS domain S-box protein [Bacteroidia bacterium]|nr:PAS domain S-box protein [Bacteroidia bacterium]
MNGTASIITIADQQYFLAFYQDITERKQAENEILKISQHYQSLIEKAPDGIVLIDADGNFKYISPSAKKMFGYNQTDEISGNPARFTHPDDLQMVLSGLEKILKDPAYVAILEYRFIDKLGQWHWVETTFSNLLANPSVESIVLNFRDITERKQNEEKLVKSEERYALVIKATEQGIWDWNVETGEVFYSEQWKKQIGYNDNELKNEFNTWFEHIHPDEREYCSNAINSYLQHPVEHFILDFRFRHKDGTYRWIHNNAASLKNNEGKVIRLFGTHTDITESKLNEAIFKDIIEKSPISIQILDMEGYPIQVNSAHTKLFGVKLPSEYSVLKDPLLLSLGFDKLFDRIKRGEVIYFPDSYYNVRNINPSFPDFPVWVKAVGFTLNDINGIPNKMVLMHDNITERKNAEALLNDIIENNPLSIQIVDKEGYTLRGNPAFIRLFGSVPPPEFSIFDDLKSKSIELEELVSQVKNGGMVHLPDVYFNPRDAVAEAPDNPLWIQAMIFPLKDSTGKPERFVLMHENITERKIAEQELIEAKEKAEKSEEKFKLLNRLTTEMLLLQDTASLYKFINEKLQKHYPNTIILNNSIDESHKLSRLEAFSGLDNSLLNKLIELIGYSPVGKSYKLTEIHNNYFKSGDFVEFEGGLAKFSASDLPAFIAKAIEKIVGLHKIYTIGINKDDGLLATIHFFTFNKQVITDGNFIEIFAKQVGLVLQKKIDEKALITAKEKAEESDRLKSAFLANMSHEIRTPMNGILGFAGLLKEPELSGEQQQKYIQIIEKSGARMLNIINDIMNISKIESGIMDIHPAEMNINNQLKFVYESLKFDADDKNLYLNYSCAMSDTEAFIKTDIEKFHGIISNLVKNAIKYTDKGTIEFGYNNKGEELEFYVKDTGIGIPHVKHEVIFERFIQADFTDKMARQGAGLGLAISKAYAEMLGGKIWVESEMGIGSTFYFRLPFNTNSKEKINIQNDLTADTANRIINPEVSELKVLIVEDDENSGFYLATILKNISSKIFNVTTGIEAIKICQNNPDINLILMDIQMPEMNGYEATQKIREFNKEVIIIAQTAFAMTGDKEKSIAAGCSDYISKPIKKYELELLIQNHFNKKI